MNASTLVDIFCKSLPESNRHIRFELKGNSEMTNWSPWLTSPSQGYLEIKLYGPFLVADVCAVEIKTDPEVGQDLISRGFTKSSDGGFLMSYNSADEA